MNKQLFFCISIIFISCGKIDKSAYVDAVGDYEWVYSLAEVGDSYAFDTVEDRYGIRIKENSKIFLFKNGKKIEKQKIKTARRFSDNHTVLTIEKNGIELRYEIKNNVLTSTEYPYKCYSNQFTISK